VFNDITLLFFGTEYVTANIYFIKICEIRKKNQTVVNLWQYKD